MAPSQSSRRSAAARRQLSGATPATIVIFFAYRAWPLGCPGGDPHRGIDEEATRTIARGTARLKPIFRRAFPIHAMFCRAGLVATKAPGHEGSPATLCFLCALVA